MKVPPKRKGNLGFEFTERIYAPLNESPSEKEGKYCLQRVAEGNHAALNESPSEKEGKCDFLDSVTEKVLLPQ